ncbi:MAG TPA: nucleotidyltransferase [Candidatus Acidoferrum sp.]
MPIHEKHNLEQILVKIGSALDIPDFVYEYAVLKYEGVGAWLAAGESELKDFSPEIYPQGSFRLGTVVHPLAVYDYDIDLVCLLNRTKEQTSQKDLKNLVGNRLKKNPELKGMLSPGCRCWLIDYPTESGMPGFHMDVLPAIPNPERGPTGILLTDTELFNWQKSSPKKYAEWFYSRMKVILMEKRAAAAVEARVDVEDIPEWQIKTPLQVAVQILKRHRDIYFQNSSSNRPPSIILTTLAAMAYRHQATVYDSLLDIVLDMSKHVEQRDGKWWISNPVEPEENFADRWNQYPERRESFMQWLGKAQQDLSNLSLKRSLNETIGSLKGPIGTEVMEKVAHGLGLRSPYRPSLVPASSVPALGDISHRQSAPWLRQIQYRATVRASVYYKRESKKALWRLATRSVPKNVWLKFELETDTPRPYEIAWQVVNTGKEAADANDLRGRFHQGDGIQNRIHWESTKYRGTHWVEGFIVKGGVIVATSTPVFVKIR